MKTLNEQFKELFPLKLNITQEIIDEADIQNTNHCIGALTLKNKFPNQWISWGRKNGNIEGVTESGKLAPIYSVITEEGIDLMDVTEPMEVTFILL